MSKLKKALLDLAMSLDFRRTTSIRLQHKVSKALKIYGLSLAKTLAILLAVVVGVWSPVGLAFMSCMDSDQRISSHVNLWNADYCSEMVGLYLVLTTAEFLYLGLLTEFRVIPRLAGFLSIGITGAIAYVYLIGIVTSWD